MAKVITYSRTYPPYHHMRGTATFFVEKFLTSIGRGPKEKVYNGLSEFLTLDFTIDHEPKNHTIRKGNRFKKGDYFSPRVWGEDINLKSGKKGPYHSKQIILAPDTLITDVWDFSIRKNGKIYLNGKIITPQSGILMKIAKNDGLELKSLLDWFKYPKPFEGQIICWNKEVKY